MSTKPSSGSLQIGVQSRKLSAEQRKEIAILLYAIATATGEQIQTDRMDLYLQAVDDLPSERLQAFLRKCVLECRWLPKIPDIVEGVLGKRPGHDEQQNAEADAAWLRVLTYANHWHPDVCPCEKCPNLTARESRALRIAGGVYMLWTLQDDGGRELAFMRKAFEEAFKRAELTAEALGELNAGEVMRSLGTAPHKALKSNFESAGAVAARVLPEAEIVRG